MVANRYKIENSITPTKSTLSESDRVEMEEFIDHIKLLVNTLGHKVFDEKRETTPKLKQETFLIKSTSGADAQGEPTSDGFVVFKGSKARLSFVDSLAPYLLKQRNFIIDKGILKLKEDHYEFTEDYIFSSPSAAAVMVLGRNSNGPKEWKLPNGETLKEFEAKV